MGSPENIVPNMLDDKQQHEGLPSITNTFGVGYNLDSRLWPKCHLLAQRRVQVAMAFFAVNFGTVERFEK